MWTNVITAFPADNFAGLAGNAFPQFAGEAVGDFGVFCLRFEQLGFKTAAKYSFQAGQRKTCSKFKPGSLPESKSSNRRLSSELTSASERPSLSRP